MSAGKRFETDDIHLSELVHQLEDDSLLRALVQSTSIGLLLHDGKHVIAANKSFIRLIGYEKEDLSKLSVAQLISCRCVDHHFQLTELHMPHEAILHREDQSTLIVEVETSKLDLKGHAAFISSFKDVSWRQQFESSSDEIANQLKQQQKLESIGMLAAGVAHEVNNPITGIINYAELIKRQANEQEHIINAAEQIGKAAERVGKLLSNLLGFARPNRSSFRLERVLDVVEDTRSLMHAFISKDQIKLEINIPHDLPVVRCHRQQLQQVLMNLITNAKDALNERFPKYDQNKKISISACEFSEGENKSIRISVEDRGTGIAPEARAKIFMPFYSTKRERKGTGLGLSVSRSIIAEHQGEISVESELGEFTRFYIDLPVGQPLAVIATAV